MVDRLWESVPRWNAGPGGAPWPYVSRKPYLRTQFQLGAFGLLLVVVIGVLSAERGVSLVSPAVFLAISFGVATGASLGLWLWRRTRSRFEAGIPVFRVSWPVWVLFLPLTILSAILFAFVLGLSEDWQNAVFWGEIMLIVVLVAMGMALRAVSVISIARYQSSKRTRLIAEYLGNSSLDVREVRILGEPRAS